jgi:hypothetical protein
MRNMQAREGEPGMPPEPQTMPQQEGEAVAQTTATRKGGAMYGESFTDRIKEHKNTIIKVIAVIAIAAIMSIAMVRAVAVDKNTHTKDIEQIQTGISTVTSRVTDVENNVNSILAKGPLATEADLTAIADRTRALSQDVIREVQGQIQSVRLQIGNLVTSPADGHLVGTFNNGTGTYVLYAKSNEADNFTANIHLGYSQPPVLNATTYQEALEAFYAGIDWTASDVRWYTPALAYNGTVWAIAEIWFNIGVFELPGNETAIPVVFGGLNATYKPDFLYPAIYRIVQ